ncbi:hypothetical protein M3Y94_00672600 [Aphelenchoides besseyi]|nr:hypothetical protein M3Y94_00672600 [Aphelenchoides besseyi]
MLTKKTHERTTGGWKCSCCGCYQANACNRNVHERTCHNFVRSSEDIKVKEAVKIPKSQLPQLFNVSFFLVDVQKSAIESTTSDSNATTEELQQVMDLNPQKASKKRQRARAHIEETRRSSRSNSSKDDPVLKTEPVRRPTKRSSSASIELVTLDSSDDESQPTISVHRPLQVVEPLDHSAHLSRSSKQVRLVEEITLDDSDDDLLPEPTIQTPRPNIRASHFAFQTPQPTNSTSQFTTPTPRSRSFASAPQPTTQNRSRANDLMTEMFKKPQVVYYDYKAVGYELSVLPISIWKNCADCELLILRSDSADWKGTIELGDPFCRFHLNEAIGYFLGYAKPSSQLLANRFKGRLSNLTSFNQLIEGMHGMDFRSTLIISNEINRASIDSLSSQHFVFL